MYVYKLVHCIHVHVDIMYIQYMYTCVQVGKDGRAERTTIPKTSESKATFQTGRRGAGPTAVCWAGSSSVLVANRDTQCQSQEQYCKCETAKQRKS